jgi:uncharacterized protein with von Willebrand factor type A (vWA) domain
VLIDFFFTLKDAKIPVSIKEFLILLEAMQKHVGSPSLDDFYYLSRMTLVKDEAHYDKFDKAFGLYFKGIDAVFDKNPGIPLDWLMKRMQHELTPEQKAQLEKFGYDKLMDRLKELLAEQKEHLAVRQRRAKSGRHPHRRRRRQPHRGQNMGNTFLPRLRLRARTRHAQYQGCTAPPAQVRAGRSRRRVGARRHHPRYRQ